jgi:O-antigen/teichoic acid export membrane protein
MSTMPQDAPGLLHRLRATLRRNSLDNGDADSRSQERYRRALISGIASGLAKAVSVVATLVSIPVTLDYLGVERFGVWMTLSSFAALMAFADFGLGNSLMNAVAAEDARGDSALVRRYVSAALALLTLVAALLIAGWFTLGILVPWGRVLGVAEDGLVAEEVRAATAVFVTCLALGIPATVIQRVQAALQLGYIASIWQLISSILALAGLVAVVIAKGNLVWLAIATFGLPVVVGIANSLVFWCFERRTEAPAFALVRRADMAYLARSGVLFFALQFAASLAYASDNLIIAQALGPDAVAQYSVVARLFEGVILILGLFVTPLWPAYAEAAARGDTPWIRRTLRKSLQATAAIVIAIATGLVVFGKPIIEAWVGTAAGYSFALVAAYGAWTVAKGLGATVAAFLNGMNVLRFQVLLAFAFTAFSLAAKIGLASRIGLPGLPLALLTTYVVTVLLPYGVVLRRMMR